MNVGLSLARAVSHSCNSTRALATRNSNEPAAMVTAQEIKELVTQASTEHSSTE